MKSYDVFSYGMISSSRLYILRWGFPKPDQYAEIDCSYKMIGGEAANSSIVLSALGLKVKIDGNWLSLDENGRTTKDILNGFKIDTSRLKFKKSNACPNEIVFSDEKTRTIFGNYCHFQTQVIKWNRPQKSDIANAEIVCLDPFFYKESLLTAKYSKQLNIPYVTVDCKYSDEILKDASITIISKEFRNRCYANQDEKNLFKRYVAKSLGLIVFTSGDEEIIYGRHGGKIEHHTPRKIKAIDTAGAGDSFRSGMIYGVLKKWSDKDMITFSSALASLVCLRFPGVLNSPKYNEVIDFMKKPKQCFS